MFKYLARNTKYLSSLIGKCLLVHYLHLSARETAPLSGLDKNCTSKCNFGFELKTKLFCYCETSQFLKASGELAVPKALGWTLHPAQTSLFAPREQQPVQSRGYGVEVKSEEVTR